MGFAYHPTTGKPRSVTTPEGSTLTYNYDGMFLTQKVWGGIISGSVDHSYDKDFRLTSISVNGADAYCPSV